MKPKTIITVILLLFVAASVAYLAVGELAEKPDVQNNAVDTTPTDPPAGNPDSAYTPGAAPPATDSSADKPSANSPSTGDPKPVVGTSPDAYVNVYYFHGDYRCITCRTIEMYTREAVNEAFLKELGDGSLHLRILNMQDPENEAFVHDFGLEYYIVVLEKVVDGKRVQWKKLEGVWDLLKDKDAFKDYVVRETRDYLKGLDR